MRTNITFLESLRKHFSELHDVEITVEESKDYAEEIVSKHLLNRLCSAYWFKKLREKHPHVDNNFVLKPLHGEDYAYFLNNQESSLDTIWKDLVSPIVKNGGCVPVLVVKELLRHMEGRIVGDKSIVTKITELGSQYRIDLEIDRNYINIKSNVTATRKQCAVIRPKKQIDWIDHSFDWNLVSCVPYMAPAKNEELISEDNLVFGINHEIDDEITED